MSDFRGRGRSRGGYNPNRQPYQGQQRDHDNRSEGIRGYSKARGTNKPYAAHSVSISGDQHSDTPVNLTTNYVKVKYDQSLAIYHYHVDYQPELISLNMRTNLIQKHSSLFKDAFIYDKQSTIMSLVRMPEDLVEFKEIVFKKPLKIIIKKVAEITIGDTQMIQFLNLQLRQNFSFMPWVQILRNFYDFNKKIDVPEQRIQILPGIVSSIKECKFGVVMAMDAIHKVIQVQTCLDIMNSSRGGFNRTNPEFQGVIVITLYNNRTYRVCGINPDMNPMSEFERKDGSKINFIQYYAENYNIHIRNQKQPLMIATPSNFEKKQKAKKLFLVPELCYLTGLTQSMQRDFNSRRLLNQKTNLTPEQRVKRFHNFIHEFNSNTKVQEESKKWSVNYDNKLLNVEGVKLAGEKIMMNNESISFNQKSADFTREIRSKSLFKNCEFRNWHIICSQSEQRNVDSFMQNVFTLTKQFGIRCSKPNIMTVPRDNIRDFFNILQQISNSDIVVVIIPRNANGLYEMVKKHLCSTVGIPSQCITSRIMMKNNLSISGKIVLQMAVKIGAEPWVLDFSSIASNDLMVIGFDVYRDKSRRKKSVGAFVASLNNTFSSWYSKTNTHEMHEETSSHFSNNIKNAFNSYRSRNGRYPSKVIVFRDAVSEGQYNVILDSEVKEIENMATTINKDCEVSFICINKRIITRYFQNNNNQLENPVSGTVVNTSIVNRNFPQFFLVSQATTQGTVAPASYDIIYNKIGWQVDKFQKIAYKLCHLYYNWTGIISVPSACQYAHKLAYLVGECLDKSYSPKLAEKLFYL